MGAMKIPAVRVEERLLALESVYECKVLLKQVPGEAGARSQCERMVVYVVPTRSVGTDRVDQWILSLRNELANAEEGSTDCDLIAVSRLPLTDDGQIDEAELA